ncbi:MAG TPA: response regulator transcription factor [Solirubrobacteraceae bacterium]|jgi:DNA-binding NarL/FixJ family response regulator|nr:response regulator transcription factor [Solirubrobacteraceae bacterium]
MRVVVADDSALLTEGLTRILSDDGHEIVAVAHDEPTALATVEATMPDLVVLDVRMPPDFTDEGIRVARRLRHTHPGTGVLLLSQHVHLGGALELFKKDHGGLGYMLKDRVIEIDSFLDAVRRVAEGGSVIDPLIVQALVTRQDPAQPLDELTARELDVLTLMAEGMSNSAIATRLVVSIRTVETHVNNVFLKLNLPPTATEHRRVCAVVTYLGHRA